MNKKCCVIIGIVLSLTACAAAPPIVWDKPGVTQEEFKLDNYNCVRDAKTASPIDSNDGLIVVAMDAANQKDFYKKCMEAHGYTEEVIAPNPVPGMTRTDSAPVRQAIPIPPVTASQKTIDSKSDTPPEQSALDPDVPDLNSAILMTDDARKDLRNYINLVKAVIMGTLVQHNLSYQKVTILVGISLPDGTITGASATDDGSHKDEYLRSIEDATLTAQPVMPFTALPVTGNQVFRIAFQ